MLHTALALSFAIGSLACGGGGSDTDVARPEPRSVPIARPPDGPPAFVPRIVDVVSVPGRVRSLAQLPSGAWVLSRFSGAQTVPGILDGTTLGPLAGWTANDVRNFRPAPDGSAFAFTEQSDPVNPEIWVQPAGAAAGRRVGVGYMLNWLDAGHLIVASAAAASFGRASLDVLDVATAQSRTLVPAVEGRMLRGAAGRPDGAEVAYLSYPVADASGIEASDVYVVPGAGGEPRALTNDGPGCLDAAWTPDGRFVLYSAQGAASRDVFAVPAQGGAPIALVTGPGEDGVPAASRDGRALRFATFEGGDSKILTWEVARAGGPRVLAQGDADRVEPALAPDGFRFAYVLRAGRAANVMLGRLDDGSTRALTETPETESQPVWSPDGRTLAYMSRRDGGVEIVLHVFRGEEGAAEPPIRTGETPLTTGAHVVPSTPPQFSQDGRQLAFLALRNGGTALVRVPVGGGDPVEVAPEVVSFAWDPRQPALLYVRPRQGGGSELVRARIEGHRPPEVVRVDVQRLTLVRAATGQNAVFCGEAGDRLRVVRLDLATGRRDPLVDLPETTDFFRLSIDVTGDGRFVTASVAEVTSRIQELQNLSEGLR